MNKIECVNAVLDGKKGDWIPAGFWYHYDHTLNTYSIAQSHLRTFRETGVDVYKVMQDYVQPIDVAVKTPSDWDKVSLPGTSVRMAIAFIGILPILIIYPFVQKYLVEGVVIGAVKG